MLAFLFLRPGEEKGSFAIPLIALRTILPPFIETFATYSLLAFSPASGRPRGRIVYARSG